jgi:beta-lactamase regulating signal transducer with metallopeptidase domain
MPIAAFLSQLGPGLFLAWLATYLVHSTLLIGAAWAASRLLRGRELGVEEAFWKAALVGGLLTAAAQTALAGSAAPSPPAAGHLGPAVAVVASAPVTELPAGGPDALPAPDPRLSRLTAVLPGWQRLLLAGWLLGAIGLAGGLGVSWVRLRLRLRSRREVAAGPVRRLFDGLVEQTAVGRARRVRLTGSPSLPVPVALGVGEREICLPRRVLTELGERRQRGLLAHELAHLERRDPAWLLAARAIECLLFLQPLNRLARSRLQEISEIRCDAWAVAVTGDRVGLARCLTEVAGWLADRPVERGATLPVPGMTRSRKRLGERVKRILEDPAEEPTARRRWLPAAAGALLLAAAVLVPGLAPPSFAAPRQGGSEAAASEGGGPAAGVESETPAGVSREAEDPGGGPAEGRAPEGFQYEYDYDFDVDHDFDFRHDFDFQHDFELDFDADGIAQSVAEVLAAAEASLLDPDEMAAIVRETREAMGEMEWARIQAEIERAREELERANLHYGEDLEAEIRRAHEELERAGEEFQRAHREVQEGLNRDLRVEREEVLRELERAREEARRGLEVERRELEEERREIEREREQLEKERRREAPPPRSPER